MKRFLFAGVFISIFLLSPAIVLAQSSNNQTKITKLSTSETINRNYFAGNERVEVSGTVNGDAFVAGGVINIDGKINGDLLVAGGEVTISGEVSDDVRVAGGQVRISGKVGKNLTIAGGSIDVTESASIGQAVVVFGGNVNLNAPVAQTINAFSGTLTLNNSVGGDVDVMVGSMRVTPKASINGNLNYRSEDQAAIDEDATIKGEVTRLTPTQVPSDIDKSEFLGFLMAVSLFFKVINLLSWFILGLIVIKFFPKFFRTSVGMVQNKTWNSLGVGAIALILIPVVSISLLLIVVGFPLGLILFGLYFIAIYFARLPAIYFVGEWVTNRFGRELGQVWILAIGLLLYAALTLIPIVGGLINILTIVIGFGACLLSKQKIYSELRKKDLL